MMIRILLLDNYTLGHTHVQKKHMIEYARLEYCRIAFIEKITANW